MNFAIILVSTTFINEPNMGYGNNVDKCSINKKTILTNIFPTVFVLGQLFGTNEMDMCSTPNWTINISTVQTK